MAAHQRAQMGMILANAHLVTDAVNGAACSKGSTAASDATKQVKQMLADYDAQHDDVPEFP
ncbi:MAG TPA: hypothetical protein VFU72_04045 [Nitrolancea sp.]|nr:hypothetical protein [Nitrolancea sp.]